MPGFTLTKKAKADLKEVAHYTQCQWGRDQRDKYLATLDSCFHQLASNPLMGKDCSHLPPALSQNGVRHVIVVVF